MFIIALQEESKALLISQCVSVCVCVCVCVAGLLSVPENAQNNSHKYRKQSSQKSTPA